MNRRIRKQSTASNYLRYLRPGALAKLRDSKIVARSHLRSHISQISLHRTSSLPTSPSRSPIRSGTIQQHQHEASATLASAGDVEFPFVSARFYAPRFPQRKKLMAIRLMNDGPESSVCLLPLTESHGGCLAGAQNHNAGPTF
ncbi:uncharacterized protein [Rutidosis leptorrhynchoides]|uniref:uncharacterized protein n=1 Tax=Rutidosis leptorrhynchoides TaxID=125765 RepID=UPI003A9A14C2